MWLKVSGMVGGFVVRGKMSKDGNDCYWYNDSKR